MNSTATWSRWGLSRGGLSESRTVLQQPGDVNYTKEDLKENNIIKLTVCQIRHTARSEQLHFQLR